MTLFDNHNRPITYLRLAVTDRCNLRCFYCMPEEGIQYLPKKEVLTYEEIIRLVTIMAGMGISKLRLTGGEPFVRTDLMKLIRSLTCISGLQDIHLTTNGILTAPYIPELKQLGIASVNLSLDTLDPGRFKRITRRNEFDATRKTLDSLLSYKIPVKVNTVVMDGKNIDDIIPMVELTRQHPIAVRFIEEMPFNGTMGQQHSLSWNYKRILAHITDHYQQLEKIQDPDFSTSYNYRVPGYTGSIGVIAAFSRTFCGTCNRIRLTAQGMIKTCLYDDGVLNIKSLMRSGASDSDVINQLTTVFRQRPKDGFEAEAQRKNHKPANESMSTIGG